VDEFHPRALIVNSGRRQLALIGFGLALVLGLAQPVAAASGEQIISFDSQVKLESMARADITETIVYDFGNLERHGLLRDIPTDYKDAQSQRFKLQLVAASVTSADGQAWAFTTKPVAGGIEIQIGDASKLVTGQQTYKIHYTLQPLVTSETNLDNFRYNVTGNNWTIPILAASATVTTPVGKPAFKSICYTGAAGSTDQNCTVTPATGELITTTTTKALAAGEGLTVGLDFAKGSFSSYLTPIKPSPWERWLPYLILGYLLIIFGLLMWPVIRWYRERRSKLSQTIIAEYEAPDGLTPGELGTLMDNKAEMREITAMLIDLAVRSYLKIEQTKPAGVLSKAEYRFTKLKEGEGLAPLEQSLFTTLFANGAAVDLVAIDRTVMAATVTAIKKGLMKQLDDRGYYQKSSFPWLWLVILIAVGLPVLTFGAPFFIFLIIIGVAMGVWKRMTPAGKAEWAKVAGFRLFLSVTETDRLKFSDAPERTPEQFSKHLPAAVALGVEKQWAKQFEGIDIAPAMGWYGGNGALTAGIIASDLGGGFSSAVATGFAPVSSGSNFSSGGGFSGGGFGGGGGGSW
jgi:uncharacterized membrane protein YgcG